LIKANGNTLKLTLQVAILNNSSSNKSNSSQSSNSVLETVECASIDSGINLINSYISKKVNLSHCKAIVISEELAYEGLSEYLYTIVNNVELRPDCNILISKCNASEFLKNSEPTLESVSARYYELILNSSEYTGYSENITLSKFYYDLLSTSSQAHAILGAINTNNTHNNDKDLALYNIEGSYTAGETPIESNVGIENMGLAVFRGDKLVGELNGSETLSHLIITNDLDSCTITIPSPFQEGFTLTVSLTLAKNTKNCVEFINNTPFISSTIYLTANILSMDENLDYSNNENLEVIQEYLNTYLEENILECLYKTSKEFRSDIFDFGNLAVKKYSTWTKWGDSDWLSNYENSFFKVEVNSIVQAGQLFTKI